jgi:hypothetical protein
MLTFNWVNSGANERQVLAELPDFTNGSFVEAKHENFGS